MYEWIKWSFMFVYLLCKYEINLYKFVYKKVWWCISKLEKFLFSSVSYIIIKKKLKKKIVI